MNRSTHFQLIWRFLRRTFTGAVLIYVFACCILGEKSGARTAFYSAAGAWTVLQIGWIWIEARAAFRSNSTCQLNTLPGRIAEFIRRPGYVFEIVAFNLALTLFLAECSLRFYATWSGRSLLVADTIDAYKLVPGHDYGGGLRGNNFGYPGKDFVIDKRPGVRRLAVLGDSFAVGPAVPFADNFLALLETELPGLEVYNFGISSTGPREYQTVLQNDVWQFQPDMVMVCVFVGNDITESLPTPRGMSLRKQALYQFVNRAGRMFRERARQPVLSIASAPDQFPRPALADETFREIEARRLTVCQIPSPAGMEKKWRVALSHLEQIVRDCENRRVPLSFVLIPDEFQVNATVLTAALRDASLNPEDVDLALPQRRLLAFCADRMVPCLDLLPILEGVPDTYAVRDTHWNVRGNHLAAHIIAPWITNSLK